MLVERGQTNRLLGYPADARLLIINADDFGMCHAVNAALDRIDLAELELEFRAQIESVLAAGLHPTHLDWHALRIGGRPEIVDLLFELARDYGLALRVMGHAAIAQVQSRGLPCNDHDFLDSYTLAPADQPACYHPLLRALPAGLSEWAVHPGLENAELLAIEGDSRHIRQRDFDFLRSPAARASIEAEGIILLDYRALQTIWRNTGS